MRSGLRLFFFGKSVFVKHPIVHTHTQALKLWSNKGGIYQQTHSFEPPFTADSPNTIYWAAETPCRSVPTQGSRHSCCIGYRKGDEDIEGEGDEDGGDEAEEEEEDEEVLDEMLLYKALLLQTFPGYEYVLK